VLDFDQQRLLGTVVLLVTAAFVASRWIKPPFGVWWRRSVIIAYLCAAGIALLLIGKWLLRS
jgi:hypothetical protein